MRKLFMFLLLSATIGAVQAQTETTTKVKPTTTPAQKVHNTFSRHKHYKGVKAKTKTGDHKTVTEVTPAEIKTKDN